MRAWRCYLQIRVRVYSWAWIIERGNVASLSSSVYWVKYLDSDCVIGKEEISEKTFSNMNNKLCIYAALEKN